MILYYLKYAIRNFKSNRLVFAGSIVTVFLSTLCISLLYSYLHNELTMDSFHSRSDDIFMFTVRQSPETNPSLLSPEQFFNFNYKDYPEIEAATSIYKFFKNEVLITYEEQSYSSEGIITDSSFFKIFDYNLKIGNDKSILLDMDAVVLSKEFAKKIFGKNNPIGETVEVNFGSRKNYVVKGIVATPPSNSSITFDFILPKNSAEFSRTGPYFILVNKKFNKLDFSRKIENIGNFHPQYKNGKTNIVALKSAYFSNEINNRFFTRHGSKKNIYILFAIIGVIFLISMLNFSNLQIVNINDSLKKIGVQKISGAESKHIFYQKFYEILLIIIFSSILVSIAFVSVLPRFNRLTGIELTTGISHIFAISFVVAVLLMAFAIIYPSAIIYKLSIIKNLKKQLFVTNNLTGRNIIMVLQFSLSLVLLIVSIVVTKQLNLMLNKDLGFESANIISTQIFHEPRYTGNVEEIYKERDKLNEQYQYVTNELRASSSIKKFSQGGIPIETHSNNWKNKKSSSDIVSTNMLSVAPGYEDILNLQLTEGRFFEKDNENDKRKVVINEAAKRFFEITDISTDKLKTPTWFSSPSDIEILGVVKDFNYEHLSVKPRPLIMSYSSQDQSEKFLIQFQDKTTQAGIQFVQKLFSYVNPQETFTYTFLSDDIQKLYQKEKALSQIYSIFTFVAYIISMIGLFTTSLYEIKKRTKEIGIRKVNGAKISEILSMLNKDFVKWVIIAYIIAIPIAYYIMYKWLQNFAYKTELSFWIFGLSGVMAIGITLLTISWQSYRAAARNPVEALRYE